MTDEQINELLAHPRVQGFIARIADERAARILAKTQTRKSTTRLRDAAEGDLNYPDAAQYIGCPYDSIRVYVSIGTLTRGKLPFTVTFESCEKFKSTYRPRRNSKP
ncbi:MAG: hypothetical protein KIT10_14415 [Flavobacteriales bacterium]|nr:hypothetical protein [Flavobacteriales bacterium]